MNNWARALALSVTVAVVIAPVSCASKEHPLGTSPSQFRFETNNAAITITKYVGSNCVVVIPVTINGLPVTGIGPLAFGRKRDTGYAEHVDSASNICTRLTSVTIPNGISSIGTGAFLQCIALTSIEIPASVDRIEDWAFSDCTALMTFKVSAKNTNYCDVDGVLFDKYRTALLQFPNSKKESSYAVTPTVTNIAPNAFSDCTSLTSVTLPANLTTIGDRAFSKCTGLTNIAIPARLTSIGVATFAGCTGLTSVTIPTGVTSIERSAFSNCSGLTNVTIPATITNIAIGSYMLRAFLTNGTGQTISSDPIIFSVADIPWALGSVDTNSLEVRQTGLYFQDLWITNIASLPVPGVTVQITELPPGVQVYNAVQITNGASWLRFDYPITPGQVLRCRVEYYVPDGRTPLASFGVHLSQPPPPLHPAGSLVRIGYIACPFGDGSVLLQFHTVRGGTYYVQYSANLEDWVTIQPAVVGNDSWIEWLDNGPPKTIRPPGFDSNGHRFYRVLQAP